MNFDTDKVTPIAMYIFEFSHTLSQVDLQDIWQNLPPDIGQEMQVSEVAITHPLLRKEFLGEGGEAGNATIEMPDNTTKVAVVQGKSYSDFAEEFLKQEKVMESAA